MRIPTRFKLFGQTIEVEDDSTLMTAHNWAGVSDYSKGRIGLMPISEAFPVTAEKREQTFCHELLHHLFNSAGMPDDAHTERNVEILGNLLHQALTTMEYEEDK